MALTLQNLRAVGAGTEPSALLPGQIAFNILDKIMFVGDGTDVKTRFDGTSSIGVPGEGWYSMPMDFSQFSTNFIVNPEVYGDIPTDGQVLTWDEALNHTIWTNGGSTSNLVYGTTNAAVAAAPGATLTIKINNAIGVVSPDPNDWVVVSGLPGDIYQGAYYFSGATWNKAANYAFPTAAQVPYSNTTSGLTANDVQEGIDELDVLVTAAQASANSAFAAAGIAQDAADAAQTDATQALADAAAAQATADAALPKAGGTMTGPLIAQEVTTTTLNTNQINVASGYGISFSTGALGTIFGISGTVSSTSITTAASSAGLKTAYDLANSALQRAGGTMTGAITFVAGQLFPISGINIATVGQLGVVQVGNYLNINVAGVLNVDVSTLTQPGVVQLNDTLTSSLTTQALTARAGADLQSQINSLTLASNVTLAGSLNADTGLVDSVTTLGAATIPPFAAGSPLPSPQASLVDYYVLVTTGGSYDPPGSGGPYMTENGDWFLCGETALGSGIYVWQYLGVGARPQSANYNTAGIVQLADTPVTYTGTSNTDAITPNSLQAKLSDSVSLADPKRIASSSAVKTAYDLANAALPKTGGVMTGNITFQDAGEGVSFNGGSLIRGISDAVGSTNNDIAASSTAVKSAYDLANSALQRAGGTMTGAITFVAGQTFPISGIQDATTAQKGVVQIGTNVQVSSGTISVNTATTGQLGLVQVGTNVQVSSGTISVNTATTTQLGLVQAGTNVQISSGTISILNSSTTQSGVVQLNDTVASTSTTQALTANQGYLLQQQINALSTSNNITFAGTFDSANSQMATVTTEGAAVGFVVGNPLPAASATVAEFFVIVSVAGTTTPPGGVPTVTNVGDWFLASASSWTYIAAGYIAPAASTTTAGIVELATNAETQTGTDSTRAVVSSGLQSKMSDSVSTASGTTIASSTAVKTAYDLANAAVPKSCYTALGALAAGTGTSTVGTLALGSNGQFLAANTGCSTGIEWCTLSLTCVPCSAYTGKGAIVAGTGVSTFTALPVGTNGQVLVPNSSCTTGLEWITVCALCLNGYTCAATPFNTALGTFAGDSITSGTANTTFGYNAGTAITSGGSNTFIGFCTGDAVTGGAANTAVGTSALGSNLNGNSNVAIGALALSVSICDQNVAVGNGAGCTVTTGTQNVLIGYLAGATFTNAVGNTTVGWNSIPVATVGCTTAIGASALQSLTVGQLNTAVGYNAGLSVVSNANNAFFGACAGRLQTSANNTAVGACALANSGVNNNTGVGFSAGAALTTGTGNTFLGAIAGDNATVADNSVAVGYNSLGATHTGGSTVAIGACALVASTSGAGNTAVGFLAGSAITTGSQNTLVGRYVGATTLSNNVVLSDGAGTIRFQANSTGAISFDGTNFGTSGQTLQSNGSAAVPTWVTPIWQNLTTLTLTSTTLTTLLSVAAATFRGVVINLSVSDVTGGKYHTDTLQVNHDGTTANVQVIGGAHIGTAPYTASAAVTAGNLVVSVTSATTNSTKYVGNYMTFAI